MTAYGQSGTASRQALIASTSSQMISRVEVPGGVQVGPPGIAHSPPRSSGKVPQQRAGAPSWRPGRPEDLAGAGCAAASRFRWPSVLTPRSGNPSLLRYKEKVFRITETPRPSDPVPPEVANVHIHRARAAA